MYKLNHFKFLIILTLLYGCFECKDDRVDISEGRELYQGELNVIPYQINDTVKFSSGNSPYTFICEEYSHKYENGNPVYHSDNNPCEGQYLDSYDEFTVKLNTPLSAYAGSSLHGIVKRDSVDIYLSITSQPHTGECSKLSISMTADLRFGGFLIPDGNSPSFVEENCHYPNRPLVNDQTVTKFDSVKFNDRPFYNVLCFQKEDAKPQSDYPFYYEKLYYNAKKGIIRITRSDGKIYDLVM